MAVRRRLLSSEGHVPWRAGNRSVRIAKEVKAAGADMLRGGAYKPRTSPYAFQGLETEGIKDMVEARRQTGLPIVSD